MKSGKFINRITSTETPTAIGPYLEQLLKVVDVAPIKEARLKIVIDSMYGSGGGLFPRLLSGGNLELIEIHGDPNPAFPGFAQPEPIDDTP